MAGGKVYRVAKVFHLAGLVTWLGPSTGAFLLFYASRWEGRAEVAGWVLYRYPDLVHLETLGLVVLLLSGAVMRSTAPALKGAWWLKVKLLVVFLIFLPLEAMQLLLFHLKVIPALSGGGFLAPGGPAAGALTLLDRFNLFAVIILAVTVPLVFYLAVFRPVRRNQ